MTVQQTMELALGHHQAGRLAEAEGIYRQVLAAEPNQPDVYNNLGALLYTTGRLDEAAESYRRAIALRPNLAQAHNGLGVALQYSLGRFDEPAASFQAALAIEPNYASAHYNLGLLRLLHGDFERGWVGHEWRFRVKQLDMPIHNFRQPRWDGSELNGKRILLTHEQGFGDAIQFARYAPMVKQRGGQVILECRRELVELFHSLGSSIEIVGTDQPLPEFDVHCPLLSLPLLFNTNLQNIPAPIPYLRPDLNRSLAWRDRIEGAGAGVRVGVVWAGRPENIIGLNRSIAFAKLAPLLQTPGVRFFSLQKGQGVIGEPLPDWTNELNNFADTAALIDNLDLIISIDTAVAHLAGAMGKPVWILLPFVPDWRWMLNRDTSPWYPTMRLFRQPRFGDWDATIRQVAEECLHFQARFSP